MRFRTLVPILSLLALVLCAVPDFANAQDANGRDLAEDPSLPRLSAEVHSTEIRRDEPLRFVVTVRDGDGSEPQLPSIPDFEVVSRGRSSQIRIIGGQTQTTVRFNYLLMPRGTGTFTLPPASITLDGSTYTTEPITVRVLEATAQPSRSDDLFTTAEVSTSEPWQGQQVIYTWRLFQRARLYQPQLQLPEFNGFLMEELDQVEEWVTTLNGQQYVVNEIRRAIFPQEEGELTVDPAQLRCQVAVNRPRSRQRPFDSLFGRPQVEPRTLLTDPIVLRVRPLPPAPAEFSGLVGDFRLEAKLSKQELAVGESATLTLTVRGEGNAQMIPEPRFPELTAFKIYDDKPGSTLRRNVSGLSGSRTFRKALVPLAPGTHTVPAITLTYFDPGRGEFLTQKTAELTLEVAPGEGEESLNLIEGLNPAAGKVGVRVLGNDVLPIYRDLDAVERRDGPVWSGLFALLLGAPPLIFGLLVMADRHQQRRAGDRRRRQARGTARERLDNQAPAVDDPMRAQELSRALRCFIGDALGIEGGALTPAEAAQHLQRAGVEAFLAVRTEEMLSRLEAIQYGASAGNGEELRDEVDRLLDLLDGALP